MHKRSIALAAASACLLSPLAWSQGQDLCANAQVIAGTGSFPFDNSTATTDGTPNPLCFAFGTDDIANDVWFDWVAPTSNFYRLNTCGQTGVDTKIGIYDGGCAGAVLACNDDTCGLQSEVTWNATAGGTYIIRLGTFPGAAGGTGTFTITEIAPQLNPANGHYYMAVAAPGITWTDADAAAQATLFQGAPGHLATLTDQVENDFVFALGNVHNHWIGGFQDTTAPTYSEPAGGWTWVTGEPWSYTNWLPGEPNNSGAFGAEDYLELLQSATFGQTWNDVHPLEHPAGYIIEWGSGAAVAFCFGDGTGTPCPCGNSGGSDAGCANSTGSGAIASAGGTNSAAADDLTFGATHLLTGQPALLFSGDIAVNGGSGATFGDGLRCAGTNVRRLGVRVPDGSGAAAWGPGLGAQGGWTAGDTRRMQVWYRDPNVSPCGTNFNLSQGLEVVFTP